LIRYIDGQLPAGARRRLEAHLIACELCWCKYVQLASAPADVRMDSEEPGMLAKLRGAIRRWESAPPFPSNAALKHRIAGEIEPYLGPRAATSILGRVSDSGDDLLSTVEPVLALFLGSRAASKLVNRVVESVLVRGA
jgi:anti-sigma factor RsiW